MRIHHLNLCTMCPFGGRLLSGHGSMFAPAELVIHALLVETDAAGLVLVDSGLGVQDMADPAGRLGRGALTLVRPRLRVEDTALRQVERLGFRASDVRHVVVTHLDFDHAGGIADFPDAQIHVHRREHDAAMHPPTRAERQRYRPAHFAHGPRWALHEAGGDTWLGLSSIRVVAEDVALLPLHGHTRGHSAVVVRTGAADGGPEWLVHAGDAYFFHEEMATPPRCPPLLRAFESLIAVDDRERKANAARLRELRREHDARVRIFSAHCPYDFRSSTGSRS